MKTAGIFGGTFNPVHLGHLRAAQEIKNEFSLDCIFFILSATPPHKPASGIVDTAERLAMLKIAVAGNPAFVVSDMEANRPGPSYTIDTVNQFRQLHPSVSELFLIVGIDAFLEIDTWKAHADLFKRIPVIVMSRPPVSARPSEGPTGSPISSIGSILKRHIDPMYHYVDEKKQFEAPARTPVRFKAVTPIGITSTMIRELKRKSASIRYLVPDGVAAYIAKKGLYL